jgi:PAS domain S-box-containing protein
VSNNLFQNIEHLFLHATGKNIAIQEILGHGHLTKENDQDHGENSKISEFGLELVPGSISSVKISHEEDLSESDTSLLHTLLDLSKESLVHILKPERDKAIFLRAIESCHPFFLSINRAGSITHFGEKLKKSVPDLRKDILFDQLFASDKAVFPLVDLLEESADKNKIFFFSSKNSKGKFKSTVIREAAEFILLVSPVVNAQYQLSNYSLVIQDFLPHEYIAEYIFLQNASVSSLEEARTLTENLKRRNKEIESLSRFPSENPNPILRFSLNGEQLYLNEAAKIQFEADSVEKNNEIRKIIEATIRSNERGLSGQIKNNEHTFLYASSCFKEDNYLNIYLFDITDFQNEINELNLSLTMQRDFYEQILNGIPNDIAVFDKNHKYLFVNPQGIKNPEIREFMIGKDDFDYCQMKGISDDIAQKRRAIFNKIVETGSVFEWEDEHFGADGKITYVFRKMAPLLNEEKEVAMVIGYGLDITSRKEAEMRLVQANQENNRLRKFIDKTKDAIQVADKDGKMIYLNDEAKKRLGLELNEGHSNYVGEFEPIFKEKDKWVAHFNEMENRGNLTIESKNYNTQTGHSTDVEININWEEINGEGYVIAVSRDISEKKKTELELENKRKFQEILIQVSNKYINISGQKLESIVDESLAFVGDFVGVDRVYIFDYNHVQKTSSNTYEWCAEGIDPEITNLQQIPFEYIPDWTERHFNNEEMFIENVSDLPESELRSILEPQGIKSLLAIPMFNNDICIGFVGFDAVKEVKFFSNEERNLLRLFAELLVNMFERSRHMKQLESAREEIANYSKYLEERVQIETDKNLELTKSITEQEKLVTIGEISAGIAHDLNTPLGSVKIGVESIDYSLKRIFENSIVNLERSEVLEIYSIATHRQLDLFQNTSKARVEIQSFRLLLTEHIGLEIEKANELSRPFVQCQIRTDELELIQHIVTMSAPQVALDFLFALLNLKNLVDSTKLSTQRASDVVKNLRTFVRNSPDDQFKPVNLHETIQTVLSVFNHEIRKKVQLTYDVNHHLSIIGSDIKLFQLWSNLIKNALEAMEEKNSRQLIIRSIETHNTVSIAIANNGEMIEENLRKKIFDKFFSTKLKKSGTGLGLSIVQSILEDHNAHIDLESLPELTTFKITFNTSKDGSN